MLAAEPTRAPAPWDFAPSSPEFGAGGSALNAELTPVAAPASAEIAEPDDLAPTHESEIAAARASLLADDSTAARSRLADLLKKSGDIEEAEGRLPDAIAAYEESLTLRREVVAQDPDSPRELRWLWMTLETLAECRDDRGHRTQAAALYQEALASGEVVAAAAPDNPEFATDLDHTRSRLAALEAQLAV